MVTYLVHFPQEEHHQGYNANKDDSEGDDNESIEVEKTIEIIDHLWGSCQSGPRIWACKNEGQLKPR